MSDNSVTSLSDLESKVQAAQASRPIYWFTIPADKSKQTGIKKIGFVELSAGDEMDCMTRAENSESKLGLELVKASLRYVDDKKVMSADGTTDVFWGGNQPGLSTIRQFALMAYGKIHTPEEDDVKSFLGSMAMEIS